MGTASVRLVRAGSNDTIRRVVLPVLPREALMAPPWAFRIADGVLSIFREYKYWYDSKLFLLFDRSGV